MSINYAFISLFLTCFCGAFTFALADTRWVHAWWYTICVVIFVLSLGFTLATGSMILLPRIFVDF